MCGVCLILLIFVGFIDFCIILIDFAGFTEFVCVMILPDFAIFCRFRKVCRFCEFVCGFCMILLDLLVLHEFNGCR